MSDWIDHPAAVLEAWMMGQAGGGAIADILFGKVNPSGRLSETFPFRLEETPAYINYPGTINEVIYGRVYLLGIAITIPEIFPYYSPLGMVKLHNFSI